MLLLRDFVFVHVPKTGGNFVHRVIVDHAPPDWQLQELHAHAIHDEIPDSHRDLPRLAFARNPFDWYVSWFHFQKKTRDEFFLEISKNGTLGFADTMRNVFGSDGRLVKSSGGLLQTLVHMLGEGLEGSKLGRMEHMREDLLRLIGECTDVPEAMARAIEDVPRQNTSRHAHYSTYYDSELRQLVEDRERPVFEYFGYAWEDAPEQPDS